MTTTIVTGLIGMALLFAFVGFMVTWVKALPLIVIGAFTRSGSRSSGGRTPSLRTFTASRYLTSWARSPATPRGRGG